MDAGRYSPRPTFQSTPPSWEATLVTQSLEQKYIFQSTPPSWEATLAALIHHAEHIISIHASLVGGDYNRSICTTSHKIFQSTPPSWEATMRYGVLSCLLSDISIHASLVGGDLGLAGIDKSIMISIHASLVGGDCRPSRRSVAAMYFNPRLPRGRRHYIS